ncbi:MAG: hypothetical protein KGI52_13800 [Burkholderiales bacterium]|nr:hypothetical protein [Burkholderiales bacterium]
MSTPGALQASEFKQLSAEVGGWLWGTVQGAWNEKQTVSQIITDAVIGMIPLVGQATAARDIIAVGSGLAESDEKRESVWQWVLFVVLLLSLIPVMGGVLKGVGRLTVRAAREAAENAPKLAALADDIVALLNRLGHKDAVKWLRTLDFTKYESQLIERCRALCDVVILSINRYMLRFQKILPQSFVSRMQSVARGFEKVKVAADKMIPQAVKELNAQLKKIQAHLIAGGVPPPSRALVYEAQTGKKAVTYADEARLIESGAKKEIIHAGKHPQNMASAHEGAKAEIAKVYQHEDGFPNLTSFKKSVDLEGEAVEFYPAIPAASGRIKNVDLGEEGVTLFRSFGPGGTTHGVDVGKSNPGGFWWGVGDAPKTAEEWRQKYAVLDEFNRNGMVAIIHIPPGGKVKVPACTSKVSEQFSDKIAGQYLEGGGKQAAIDFALAPDLADVSDRLKTLVDMGGGKVKLTNGVVIEVRHSGWKGINGKVGYGTEVIPGAGLVERLGVTETQSKVGQAGVQQGAQQAAGQTGGAVAKDQRVAPNRGKK